MNEQTTLPQYIAADMQTNHHRESTMTQAATHADNDTRSNSPHGETA